MDEARDPIYSMPSGGPAGAVSPEIGERLAADQPTIPGDPHLIDPQEIVAALRVDPVVGLTRAQAARRLDQFGPNELRGTPPTPLWQRVALQLMHNNWHCCRLRAIDTDEGAILIKDLHIGQIVITLNKPIIDMKKITFMRLNDITIGAERVLI